MALPDDERHTRALPHSTSSSNSQPAAQAAQPLHTSSSIPSPMPARELLTHNADALALYLRARLQTPHEHPHEAPDALDEPPTDPALWRDARQAAVLAPLYARNGEPYLLFTRRSATLNAHSGEISFPGGSRDPEDADLAATALREAQEELAIAPERVTVLGTLPPAFTVVSNFLVTPYLGWLGAELPPLAPNAAEVAEVIEAPLAALDDPTIFHSEVWRRRGEAHTVYFYDFGPYRIWGLTGRLLHQLLALLPPRATV